MRRAPLIKLSKVLPIEFEQGEKLKEIWLCYDHDYFPKDWPDKRMNPIRIEGTNTYLIPVPSDEKDWGHKWYIVKYYKHNKEIEKKITFEKGLIYGGVNIEIKEIK